LGNFFTLKEIFEKYDPMVVRFMFLQTHYRNPVNFSNVLLDQAKAGLQRIHDFIRVLNQQYEFSVKNKISNKLVDTQIVNLLSETRSGFESDMDDDFNTSGALGRIFKFIDLFISFLGNKSFSMEEISLVLVELRKFDEVLGIVFEKVADLSETDNALILEREDSRKNKNFKRSDEIRDELLKKGIVLEDTPQGTIWKRI